MTTSSPTGVAYLLNQYPYTSCTFIRREIVELEKQELRIVRYSIRPTDHELIEDADRAEAVRTRCVLARSRLELLKALIRAALTRPRGLLRAATLALRIGRRSDRSLLVHLAYLAEACVICDWCRADGVSHIHCHFGTNATAVAMLCHALGGPRYSFTVHGSEEFDKPDALALDEKIQRSAFAVAISHFGRSQLLRRCPPDDWGKIHIVHCGIDEEFLNYTEPELATVPAPARLVCVGRLIEQKGQILLIEAAARLAAEGLEFDLTLVGDGPMRPLIERAIARHGLQERIRITGWQNTAQVRQHILDARAMVLPSFAEGLPVVIMEAMALHRPVISTYVAGIPELVRPGVNGWLVPPSSLEPLVAAMREALTSSPEMLARLGRAGAETVARDHHTALEATKLAKLFERVICRS